MEAGYHTGTVMGTVVDLPDCGASLTDRHLGPVLQLEAEHDTSFLICWTGCCELGVAADYNETGFDNFLHDLDLTWVVDKIGSRA